MGFASSPGVRLNSADVEFGVNSMDRLSWHLDQSHGGYRVGATASLNDDHQWYKIVMYCN